MCDKRLSFAIAVLVLLLVPAGTMAKGTFRFDDRYKAYVRTLQEDPKPVRSFHHVRQPGVIR